MADNNIAHAMALVTTRGLWALPGNLCSSRQFYAWCENIGCRFLGGPIALHCPTRAGWRQEFRGVTTYSTDTANTICLYSSKTVSLGVPCGILPEHLLFVSHFLSILFSQHCFLFILPLFFWNKKGNGRRSEFAVIMRRIRGAGLWMIFGL